MRAVVARATTCAMAMLRVANCPSQDLALTNAAFVNEADAAFVPYAELGDLVLFTRHEIRWKQNITEADAVRPAKFNFMCRCEEATGVGPSCTADHFMMLPGKFFKSFDAAVGQPDCFEHDPDHPEKDLTASGEPTQQWGHGCSQYLAEWLPADSIAYLTEWRPESFMRESGNPVGELQ